LSIPEIAMKRAIPILLAALLAVAVAFPAAAQQARPFQHEISLFGSWDDVDEPEKVEVLNLNLRYGYFMSPRLVATGSLMRSSFESDGGDSASTTFLVGAKYYFGELRRQAIVPFVDGGIGFTNVDAGGDDSTDLSWELGGGASLFFSENTSIDGALRLFGVRADARTKGLRAFLGITTRF
jgi:opacity protein-like surface antigen